MSLVSCDRAEPPPLPTPTPGTPVQAAAPAPEVASATPPVVAPAPTPPSVRETSPASAPASQIPIAGDAPKFVVVSERTADVNDSEVVLMQSSDGEVFAGAGPLVLRLESDGSIEHEASWVRGIDARDVFADAAESGMMWWNPMAMGGTWPDGTYLVLARLTGSRGGDEPPETYRRKNAIWTRIATRAPHFDWYVREFGPWKDGSVLALKGFDTRYSTEGQGDVDPPALEVKAFEAAIAREKKLVVLHGRPQAPAFGKENVQAFASLATGEIFAAMEDGTMLHHDAATASERRHVLPVRDGSKLAHLHVRATAPDRVWAHGEQGTEDTARGWLARFDGSVWTEVETECENEIASLSIDSEGSAYFTCVGRDGDPARPEVLQRVRGGVLERIPTDFRPHQVVARAPGDIWISTVPFDAPQQLWHTGTPRATKFEIPDIVEAAYAVLEWAEPAPLREDCFRVWIPLVAGSDRAAVEAKLEGVGKEAFYPEVVEARVRGGTELGVRLTALSTGRVKRSVKAVLARLGDAAGAPMCNERPPLAGEDAQ